VGVGWAVGVGWGVGAGGGAVASQAAATARSTTTTPIIIHRFLDFMKAKLGMVFYKKLKFNLN
jgi:hypothetical protein